MASHNATPPTYNQSRKPSPDYHVPLELVAFILDLRFPENHAFRTKKTMAAIYDLRLVSRLWKELIEDTPTLWTHVSTDELPTTVIRDCLRWSKSHSLLIRVGPSWARSPKTKLIKHLGLLRLHSHRWKTLHYSATALSINNQHVKDFLESPAPMLQSINAITPLSKEPTPTLNLAGGQAKALKHLSLSEVLVPWSSNLLRGLETLSLSMHHSIPAREVFNLLTKIPALRKLELLWPDAYADPDNPSPLAAPPQDITAASLEEVSIRVTSFQFTSYILSHVSMPSCKSLRLYATYTEEGDIDILRNALAQFMPRIAEALRLGGRTKLYVSGTDSHRWSSPPDYKAFQFGFGSSDVPLEDVIGWIRNLVATMESQLGVEVILETLDQQTVETLAGWNDVTKLWAYLVKKSSWDLSLLDFLGDVGVDHVDGLSWPFPNLQELVLSGITSDLLAVFGMLNRRYLPDTYLRDLEGQGISVRAPPPIAVYIREEITNKDDTTMAVLKNHPGVKSLNRGVASGG